MKEEVVYNGIKITATDELGSLEVFFSNAQGSFELGPSDDISPLEGLKSLKEAIEAGKEFVDKHQWQFVDTVGIFKIYVRNWWNDKWGYSIRCGGMINDSGFESREEAIEAAKKRIIEETEKLKERKED